MRKRITANRVRFRTTLLYPYAMVILRLSNNIIAGPYGFCNGFAAVPNNYSSRKPLLNDTM